MDMNAHKQVMELAESVEEQWRQKPSGQPYIDIYWQMWNIEWIAFYVKRTPDSTRDLVRHETFPKPVRLPGPARAHALYKAREVIAWVESFAT